MAERPVKFVITVDDGADAAGHFEEIEEAQRGVTQSTREMAQAQDRATRVQTAQAAASLDAGQKMNQLGSTIGQVGAVLARVNPKWAQMGGALAGIGAQIPALTGALGPLAQGIAIVTVAVDFGTLAFNQYGAAAEEAARLAQNLLQQEVEGIDRLVETRRQARLDERLASNMATQAEITSALAAAEERGERLAAQAERTGQNLIIEEGRNRLEVMQAAIVLDVELTVAIHEQLVKRQQLRRRFADQTVALEENTAERQRLAALTAIDLRRRPQPGRGGGRGGIDTEAGDRLRAMAETRRIEAEGVRFLAGLREADRQTRLQQEIEVELQIGQIAAQEETNRLAALNRIGEERQLAHEEQLLRLEEARQTERQAAAELQADLQATLTPLVTSTTKALASIISGAESAEDAFTGLLASFLEMLAQQAALEAVKEFAAALGSFASQDYVSGALHLVAGGAWVAVAALAGGASAAVAPSAPATPASPEAGVDSTQVQGGTNVYNFNAPIISTEGSSDRALAGREIGVLVSEGDNRFGRAS